MSLVSLELAMCMMDTADRYVNVYIHTCSIHQYARAFRWS
jgi:hypothetical protein